nr:arginine--tRNA ligase [uncultured Porphyromonas sp.]
MTNRSYHTLENHLQTAVSEALKSLFDIDLSPEKVRLDPTRKDQDGDFTLVVFPFLKQAHLKPEELGSAVGDYLTAHCPRMIRSYNVVKGFLNLSLTSALYVDQLGELTDQEHFGTRIADEASPLYMIEYSSPNTNKPLHLGHVRNNLLGYSLAQILEANGCRVIKTNIVNDRGIHICKSMLAWLKWGDGITPESSGKKGDHLVGDFYVLFDKHYRAEVKELMDSQGLSKEEAEVASPLMKEARQMLEKWEAGDEQVRSLWKRMNDWVYAGFDETYKRLGVDFDKIYYESDTYLEGKQEVLRGLDEGLFVRDEDGSVWADLREDGLDRKILLRSDGTSVYMTQDIGTAKMRFSDYPIDHMVYVVGNEQEYHFQVLSILLDKLGFPFGKELVHFSYGMVELPNGKMKSREGTVVDADDLMQAMHEEAHNVSETQGQIKELPEDERNEVDEIVGMGALKYFLLKVDPRKNMMFDPEESIDFNGNTGPFIQYTYARICSLVSKAGDRVDWRGAALELEEKEKSLVQAIDRFPSVVSAAADDLNPAAICNYTFDLVKLYNQFYHDCPVLREENAQLRSFRISLSEETGKVIKTAMGLLGIQVPERM